MHTSYNDDMEPSSTSIVSRVCLSVLPSFLLFSFLVWQEHLQPPVSRCHVFDGLAITTILNNGSLELRFPVQLTFIAVTDSFPILLCQPSVSIGQLLHYRGSLDATRKCQVREIMWDHGCQVPRSFHFNTASSRNTILSQMMEFLLSVYITRVYFWVCLSVAGHLNWFCISDSVSDRSADICDLWLHFLWINIQLDHTVVLTYEFPCVVFVHTFLCMRVLIQGEDRGL